jgi:hypothetical protein
MRGPSARAGDPARARRRRVGVRRGERRAAALREAARSVLAAEPHVVPDYLDLADPETLEPVATASVARIAMLAARVGPTRLLDNVILRRIDRRGHGGRAVSWRAARGGASTSTPRSGRE